MRIGWVVVLALASCGKSKSESGGGGSATGSSAPPIAGAVGATTAAPTTAAAAPCPTEDALTALVRSVRKLDAKLSVDARCAAGRFGSPGWYLVALVDRDGQASLHSGILATDGKRELAAFSSEEIAPARAEEPLSAFEAADLDGDGIDEVVEHWSTDRRGYIADGYLVHRLDHGALKQIIGPRAGSDNSAAQEDEKHASGCSAESALVPAAKGKQLVITVTKVFGKPSDEDCLKPGTHAFALAGDKLVEVK